MSKRLSGEGSSRREFCLMRTPKSDRPVLVLRRILRRTTTPSCQHRMSSLTYVSCSTGPNPRYTSISPSVERPPDVSSWSKLLPYTFVLLEEEEPVNRDDDEVILLLSEDDHVSEMNPALLLRIG